MLSMLWNISVAIRSCLRRYMPTNIAVDTVRFSGRSWPTLLLAKPIPALH
jgi:hypothetical protein